MTPSPKHCHVPTKIFSKNVAFFEKIVRWKNIQNLIPHKISDIHFRRQTPPSLQKRLRSQKRFFTVFSENTDFFEKTASDKKNDVNFRDKTNTFPKQSSNVPQNSFLLFSRKIVFLEKIAE